MATYKQGILGSFSGKVGTVIGSFWKGRWVMRGIAPNVHNPQTPAQMHQRARFALIGRTIPAVQGFINVSFDRIAAANSVTNANVYQELNLDDPNVIQGTGTNLTIDYTNLILSRGYGINPASPAAVQGTGQTIDITWVDNAGISPETLSTDIVMAIIYNPARNASAYDVTSATRLDSIMNVAYPALWTGEEAHIYIATRSQDGEIISNSQHLATITLA